MRKTDGHFYIDYDEKLNVFMAKATTGNNDILGLIDTSRSLNDLLNKCRERGLTHIEGVSNPAIDEVLEWLHQRPALEFIETLWEGESNLLKGPIGFVRFDEPKSED